MRIVLLGPPGAGKGTLAGLMKERLGLLHISTGDLLRDEMKGQSALGQQIRKYVEGGDLVPDEIVIRMIESKLTQDKTTRHGYLFDGFPRTTVQAKDLDRILEKIGQPIEIALYMETSMPTIIQRLTGRRICRQCGAIFHLTNRPPKKTGACDACHGELYQRADDNEETIRNRMDVYVEKTAPIIDYYEKQGKLERIAGDKEAEDLLKIVVKILNAGKQPNKNKVTSRA